MDGGKEGLHETLNKFQSSSIRTIGAGRSQEEAEKPLIKVINGKRVVLYSAYWHRNGMYMDFDFYALGYDAGVANLSGSLMESIKREKEAHPESFVIVMPHWGVDFQTVSSKQRQYAHSLMDIGADLIIGHGAHMIQEIEQRNDKYIVYSIGNGVFNSDGEYNRRHVAPYSLFAQLLFEQDGLSLRLYPIYTNNLKTFWQPSFVNREQFDHCSEILKSYHSSELKSAKDHTDRFYYGLPL